jgi:uncharacterized protein
MKYLIFVAGIFTVVFFIFLTNFSIYGNRLKRVVIKNVEFRSEVVSSLAKKSIGLGRRKGLCFSCAMLFVFPAEGNYNFWMKDMNFNLDIIWIRENKIAKIEKNISKERREMLQPGISANRVLEINAGLSDKYGFKEGDEVIIK